MRWWKHEEVGHDWQVFRPRGCALGRQFLCDLLNSPRRVWAHLLLASASPCGFFFHTSLPSAAYTRVGSNGAAKITDLDVQIFKLDNHFLLVKLVVSAIVVTTLS